MFDDVQIVLLNMVLGNLGYALVGNLKKLYDIVKLHNYVIF